MNPVDIPTLDTTRFVTSHIKAPSRILEIGCGDGEVAAALQVRGHEVVAIDSDETAVANARLLGVDARTAHWPQFSEKPFDTILFTRSLHHIHPLAEALDATNALLRPGGSVIVEDFAADELTAETAGWFHSLLQLLDACGVLESPDPVLNQELLAAQRGTGLHGGHHLHSAKTLLEALGARFRLVHRETAPYLYRYICRQVGNSDRGRAVVEAALDLERNLSDVDTDCWIGRRFVAAKYR